MLRVMIAAILCAGAGAASAGSIEPFKATTSTRTSIVEVGCPACAREAKEKAAEEAQIKLAPGQQIIEVRNVDGQMMIYRTENWLGGSPVTMVSKATELDLIALGVAAPKDTLTAETDKPAVGEAEQPVTVETKAEPTLFVPVIANTAPGIDKDTKTSALGEKTVVPLDVSHFELRLN
ncbi:MAG: hypothetical protein KUA43_11820 [Hoeflea sp.]|uniref:plant virulence effector HPE1-like domain-containing protein n=1 Tax=Hoeflea sp. TaxID=1940281 RepID=UPI001DB8C1E9|nr:plant virulence effector HPE1-like domain-containing protein [Hoeflea sp.]MBU4527699.1 hypothetical protein [Alphaproteobacteria bacterium]MBU4546433.1 hypothetical protein [Alphaproteobacteria bacterium]MBU4553049.1 hypothetical protein [Alphaproteobacteria bacterium]MBV1724121.1 hypothetical protein [Hoeflea sp.]MBV1759806.1 hypothetical protein [Hoeflea sp.]